MASCKSSAEKDLELQMKDLCEETGSLEDRIMDRMIALNIARQFWNFNTDSSYKESIEKICENIDESPKTIVFYALDPPEEWLTEFPKLSSIFRVIKCLLVHHPEYKKWADSAVDHVEKLLRGKTEPKDFFGLEERELMLLEYFHAGNDIFDAQRFSINFSELKCPCTGCKIEALMTCPEELIPMINFKSARELMVETVITYKHVILMYKECLKLTSAPVMSDISTDNQRHYTIVQNRLDIVGKTMKEFVVKQCSRNGSSRSARKKKLKTRRM